MRTKVILAVLALVVLPALALAQTSGAVLYPHPPKVARIGQAVPFSLAAAADQTVFALSWEEPRVIESIILSSDLSTAVDADSSVFYVEFLAAPPGPVGEGFTGQWVRSVQGGTTVYMKQTSGAGDSYWTIRSTAAIAADAADGLSAGLNLEQAAGILTRIYPYEVDPDAGTAEINAVNALGSLTHMPVYGVRLYYDSEATVANNTGALNLQLDVVFK